MFVNVKSNSKFNATEFTKLCNNANEGLQEKKTSQSLASNVATTTKTTTQQRTLALQTN
jgi:hypothetical protein